MTPQLRLHDEMIATCVPLPVIQQPDLDGPAQGKTHRPIWMCFCAGIQTSRP